MFSRAAGREGRCRQISLACVRSTCSVPATLGLPLLAAPVLSPSTLLRLQAALQGAGPELRAVPVFGYSTKAQTRLGLRFVPSPAGAAQAARSLRSTLSPGAVRLIPSAVTASVSVHAGWVHLVSVLGSWSLAATLPADVNHPESLSLVRNWEPVCSLVGVPSLGPSLPLSPPPGLLPPSCGGWAGPLPVSSSLELLSPSFVPKQCHPLLSVLPPLAGGGCGRLGYFFAGSCF